MPVACWTCRSRTIQCDQSDIPCAKCEKAGLECYEQRPLRWVKGLAIRGKMRGRTLGGEPNVSGRNTSPRLRQKQPPQSGAKSLTTKITPQLALQDPCIHDLDWSSRFYLDYYNIRIAKLYILYDSQRNPFRSLLTYAMDDSVLESSFDQVDDVLSPRFVNANLDALHFKQQAIKALSLSLSHPQPFQKDATMAAILLLIFLDLLESGIEGWKYHLQGAQSLVNISHSLLESGTSEGTDSDPEDTVKEATRFVAQQFLLVTTFGDALSGSDSKSELLTDFNEKGHQESIIRSFLGCPRFLLQAIHYFSNQRHVMKTVNMHDEVLVHKHVQDTMSMLKLTENFNCLQWASESLQPEVSTEEIQNLSLLAQAYRTAAVL